MEWSIKKILIIFSILILLALIGFGLWANSVISSLPLDKISPMREKKLTTEISFEAEGTVLLDEIKTFYQFGATEEEFSVWASSLLKKGKKLEFSQDRTLKGSWVNNCPKLRCLQKYLEFEKMPALFWKGLMGIEDYRFLDHQGIDPKSIARAIVHDLKKMKFEQGGSTLTQQLVKNLFFTQEKKISRKIKEVVASVYIESQMEKEDVLEAYFNEVFWGSLQGIRIKGVYSASLLYFNKKPKELSEYEVGILISLLKGPAYYHPIRKTERLKSRANVVFNKLIDVKLFSGKAKKWNAIKWEKWVKSLRQREAEKNYFYLWMSLKDTSKLFNKYKKYKFIKSLNKTVLSVKKSNENEDFAAKFYIKNIKSQESFSHYSKFERSKVKAIENERHGVGSTLKPIVYGLFLKNGLILDEGVETGPINLKLKSGNWSPREAHKNLPEIIPAKTALAWSLNRPTIRLAHDIGFDNLEKDLDKIIPRLNKPLGEYPSQLLGSVELTMQELIKVYENFIREQCEVDGPSDLLKVLSDPTQTTLNRVVDGLSRVEFFGKTGTSNKAYDNWFVFFTGREVGAIWVGYEGPRNKAKSFRLAGSTTAFKTFQEAYGLSGERFPFFGCQFVH